MKVNNEDLDKALTAFRNALRFDDRHYNALYGLGAIYYRQERYRKRRFAVFHILPDYLFPFDFLIKMPVIPDGKEFR